LVDVVALMGWFWAALVHQVSFPLFSLLFYFIFCFEFAI
jgi:hypothetical protein